MSGLALLQTQVATSPDVREGPIALPRTAEEETLGAKRINRSSRE
jgi:hypothetical protein